MINEISHFKKKEKKNLNIRFLDSITIISESIIKDNYYQWIALDLSFPMIYYGSKYV